MAIFLPIVERELRVAARKRSTFWLRIIAALVAFAIATGFLILTRVGFGMGSVSLGSGLFATLTWLSLGAALGAGLFLTSDSLSEEKRAGTMGFLFLTDLRGYDVVLGKLLATSLRGFCALLGVLPILAVSLLMGGVTGGQFWKTSLALLNALFLSLAAGLLVSAVCRESQRALSGTLLLLILLVAGGPLCDAILAAIQRRPLSPQLSLLSPSFLFMQASAWGQNTFWMALLVNQALGWSFLAVTCLILPRTWQDRVRGPLTTNSLLNRWKFGSPKRRGRLRSKLMDVNPVVWLTSRERWQALFLWLMTLLIIAGAVAIFTVGRSDFFLVMCWGESTGLLSLILYLACASLSARFVVEAQRTGLMELLLVTPLSVTHLIQGQWRSFGRLFGLPCALYLAAECLGGFVVQERVWSQMPTPPGPAVAAVTNAPTGTLVSSNRTVTIKTGTLSGVTFNGPGFTMPQRAVLLTLSMAQTISLLANFVALIWFGMWMGLNSKTVNLATLKTIVFVMIIPWFVLSFATAVLVPVFLFSRWARTGPVSPQLMMWFPWIASAFATVLGLGKDVGFSLWARKKLYSEFRERAMQVSAPNRVTGPPVIQPALVSAQDQVPKHSLSAVERSRT